MPRPEQIEPPRRDDNSLAVAVADGFQSAVYTGLQQPYDSVRQLAKNIVHVNLPEANLVCAPSQAKTGSLAWFADSVGGAAGMIPWVVASHKMVRMGTSFAGLSELAAGAGRMGVAEAGLTGATYSTLFQPVQNNGNFFANKAVDAGISFATFAGGTAVNNTLRPMFGGMSSELSSRAANIGAASLSGFGAGVINAEFANLMGKPHQDALLSGLKFGIAGGAFGAAAGGRAAAETEITMPKPVSEMPTEAISPSIAVPEIARNAITELKSPGAQTYRGERPVSNLFDNSESPRAPSKDIFGPRPEVLEQSLPEIKSRFGENSKEHASALVQIGDAHMVQGLLSNPKAQVNYEQALQIFKAQNDSSPQTAWVLDKLASVKQSSGDTAGAAADLAKALEIWKSNGPDNSNYANENHILRRTEDLTNLQKLLAYENRPRPQL